jgi:outer membrane receptor protein involved in Fe transport
VIAAWLWAHGAALAQQAEQITVAAPAAGTPPTSVTVLGAGDIARSGVSNIGGLLDQLPAFGAQGVNSAQNDGGFGAYFIDLRNLNFDRTLVLVDGRRFVLSGIQTDEAVDLNDIPLGFIDHVEVLRDGTQPQYAADAVAGVVNVVLKDQIDGLHLDTYGGAAGAGDGGAAEVTLTGGRSFAAGHVAFGLDAFNRDPVPQSDRAWSADPIASATMTQSGAQLLFGSPAAPGGHAVGPGIDSLALGNGRTRPYDPATDGYDGAPGRYLQGGLQRETAYFDADTTLTDDVTADTELLYTQRRATTLQPPQTLGLSGTTKFPDGFVIPATDPFNPYGAPVTLERVVTEAGPQSTTTSGPVWRALAGLDGVVGDWNWSLSVDHGQSESHYVTDNAIDLSRALQTAGNGPCPAASGCVEANWFGPGSLSPAALDYVTYTARSQSSYTETVGQARMAGPLFAAPGGTAKLTVGMELRAESGATTVDAVTARGDQAGNDAAPTSGGYDTYETYATLAVPLLRDLSFARRLDLTLAGRFTATSRYGAFGTGRAVLDYLPVRGLHLRAVSGTARRPPAISEAFGGITASQQPVTDPCAANSGLRGNPVVAANCKSQGLGPGFTQASPLIDVESGGNPTLRPEQSENEALGLSLDPPAWPFLSVNVDWYHYRIRDAIDSLEDTDPNAIPDLCYESAHLSSPLCGLITRIAGGGNAGQISSILGRDENVGTIKEDGLEFGATARLPASRFGALKLDWQTNWLLDYRLHTLGENGFTQYAGTFPGMSGVGSYARVRARATAEWTKDDWTASWTGRFIAGARVLGEDSAVPFSKAPGIFYEDVELSRRFGRVTAMAGIDNLADQRPPTLIDGETNTNTATYDVVGRFIWGRVSYAF